MPNSSAGVLLYRRTAAGLNVLLAHPGGPFWSNRDVGAWQIPKGLILTGENPAAAAAREFEEELGVPITGKMRPLGGIKQAGGKQVEAFAVEQALDPSAIVSNEFNMEWPPRSGRIHAYPEIDQARWFTIPEAETMMLPSQRPLLDRLIALVDRRPEDD
ncbi:MAG: hydrolase [Sphingomonas bacterium]|nr:hydrolase [Sphingomonas bacterium]MDB5683340.1 hydrolase [Sphingomonas bacterium]